MLPPFTRSLSVTFVELSEGNGVGGNGKRKREEEEEEEELVRSSRAFQGPFVRSSPSGGIQSERQIQGGLLSKAWNERTNERASERRKEAGKECPREIPRVDLSSTLSSVVRPTSSSSLVVAKCQGRRGGLSFAK